MTIDRQDWGRFWQDVGAASGATLADLPAAVQQRLDAPWMALAQSLPRGAKVLDLATGGGIVLSLLRRRRRDLKLTGVDAAPKLPDRAGITLKGGVALERLPFKDGSFAAVTSRFGIEYASLRPAAAEAARVCRPGARLCFVVHHAASQVLCHNRGRYAALHWALRDSGWLETAANVVRARSAMALPTPAAIRAAPHEAAQRFPGQSAAADFLTGLVQLLDAGLGRPGLTLPSLGALIARAEDELSRLDALFAAACDGLRLAELTDALTSAGMALAPAVTLDDRPGGNPLAWLVEGRRL